MRREEVATTWLRLDVGWRRGPSGTQVGFMKHWAWGWKSPETQSGAMRDQNGQTESSELLTAPRQREDDGRKKGGGAEAPQRDQRCTHQGLVSPFLWQGQSGGEGGGSMKTQWQWQLQAEAVGERVILDLYLSLYVPLSNPPNCLGYMSFAI